MAAWPFGRASPVILAAWERISKRQRFSTSPRLPKQSRVFCFSTRPDQERKNMNKYQTKVPAEFAPETRFELRPVPPAPFRANQETDFERLKNRLLVRELAEAPTPELNAPLRRAANEAAALAWNTLFPLLVFPVLFEEKTDAALRQVERQARIYANSRELVTV